MKSAGKYIEDKIKNCRNTNSIYNGNNYILFDDVITTITQVQIESYKKGVDTMARRAYEHDLNTSHMKFKDTFYNRISKNLKEKYERSIFKKKEI